LQPVGLALGRALPVGTSLGTFDGKALIEGGTLIEGAKLGSVVSATGGAFGILVGLSDGPNDATKLGMGDGRPLGDKDGP
jgi:hypothetical protein